ncbi:hypothetical protein FAUST_11471 [Fusarium austroamericanum]|uniref:Uncharacterized protein n=1 Tax=Fusarium austroamericanum TaxID=282268 RepID=A0AAN5YZ76_FUSAU|nr:hypothetical protein FAUST_11471 [Fusarium austroamericanum]
MESRDRVVTRQEKRKLDGSEALTTKPPEHVNHGPGSGYLIDVSGIEGPSSRQRNVPTTGSEPHITSTSMAEFLAVQKAQMDSFLQHSGELAEAQRSALGRIIDQFAGIASSLSSTVAHWLGHPTAQQGTCLYEELDRAHRRVMNVEDQCQQLTLEHQALQKQLTEAVKERNGLRKLADVANWTGTVKVSDDFIRGQWKQLNYNIRAMARALAKCQIIRPTDDANKKRFERIVTPWPNLLGNDDYKELLITAYLWTIVFDEIFEGGSAFWVDSIIHELKYIRESLVDVAPVADGPLRSGPTMRHVARWSAQGTALIGHFYGREKKAPKERATNALEGLKLFCNIPADNSGTNFLHEMKGIMETAIDLDEMLMGSLAILSIKWLRTGQSKTLRYNADQMDAVVHTKELSPKTAVAFMISPMLVKMGNADGCNYDCKMILCKSSVVCE